MRISKFGDPLPAPVVGLLGWFVQVNQHTTCYWFLIIESVIDKHKTNDLNVCF